MISARAETQFAHAYLPRDLHKYSRGAGLTLAEVQTFSIAETSYDPSSYGASVIGITRDSALKHGIPAEAVAAWNKISARVPRKANGFFAWIASCSRGRSNGDLAI